MFSLIIAVIAIALIVAVVAVSGYFGGDAISDAQAKSQAAQLVNEQAQIFTAMDGFQADNRRWPTDIQELVSAGYLRSIPAGAQLQTTATATRFELISSAHAADPLALGWSMPAAHVPIIFTVKVPKATCQAYNQASRGDNGILRQAFESLAAQCYGADGNYNVVAKKAVAGVTLAGVLPTSVEPGNLPAKDMEDWWDSVPSDTVQVPTDPDKTPKAELALTGAGLSFGQVQLGQAETSPTITLRNGGKAVAEDVSITAPAGFDLVDNTCGAQLGAGASCSFAIGFAPVEVETYTGAVTASASNGASVQLTASGSGVRGSASLSSVSFGDVPAGQQVQGDAVLTNTGVGALRLGGATVTGEGFSIAQNNCGATLAAGASCSIKVALTAEGVTSHIGVLTVPSAEMGNLLADLAGQSRQARFSVTPANSAFGNVEVNTLAKSAVPHVVTNTGNIAANGLTLKVNSRPPLFSIEDKTCGTTLEVGASCSFNVSIKPSVAGAYSSTISIADTSGASATVVVSVNGTEKANFSVSATELSFSQTMEAATGNKTLTVKNTGGTSAALSLTTTAFYSVSTSTCGAGTQSVQLAAGAQCDVSVIFTPAFPAPGTPGTLTVLQDGDAVATVALSGDAKLSSYGHLAYSATTLSGSILVGSTNLITITVTNNGDKAVAMGSVAQGTIATTSMDFTVSPATTCGKSPYVSLAPGSSCLIRVLFTPSAASTAVRTAVINVENDGTNEYGVRDPATSVKFTGTVYASAGFLTNYGAGSAESPSVAITAVGSTQPYSAYLQNTGSADVHVGAITVSGADVQVDAGTCTTVLPSTYCTLRVTSDKLPVGEHKFVVTIQNDGASGPAYFYQTLTVR